MAQSEFHGLRVYAKPDTGGAAALREIIPQSLRAAFDKQTANLSALRATESMMILGGADDHEWVVALFTQPESLCVGIERHLWGHTQKMTVASALMVEVAILRRASPLAIRQLTIKPDLGWGSGEVGNIVRANLVAGRHWAHGLQ